MATSLLPSGTPAPPFELVAAYTKRKFGLLACQGRPLLLIFISYQTRQLVRDVSLAVRERFPSADQVLVANLINLDFVPGLVRGTAERMMVAELKEAVKQLPPGFNPHDHLILLPDWKGSVFKAYQIGHLGDQVALVLVDSQGMIRGSYRGKDPANAAVALLENELTGGASHNQT
jgi:hypothetical protein